MEGRVLAGHRALITGASSGIGAATARGLAARGADLVLAARRRDRLDVLAGELRAEHGATVEVIEIDLSRPGSADALWHATGGTIDILVNNAGFGSMRPFGEVEIERERAMLQLNVMTLVELTHLFVAARRAAHPPSGRRSHILNVSSIAAWQALPWFATYAASKSFVRDFSEALYYELRPYGISVTCLCPGGTRTEFHDVAGSGQYGRIANASMLSAERVAEIGVRAMLRGRKTVVSGVLNKIACFLTARSPRGLATRSAVLVMGGPRRGALPPGSPEEPKTTP